MSRGKLVSFSGIDSAGKSTYIDLYAKELEQEGQKYKIIWSRGGYTSGCEAAKKLARRVMGKKLPESGVSEKRTEMFKDAKISGSWYIMALLDLIRLYGITFRWYKLLGYTVIADRYIFDTQIDFSFMFGKEFLKKSRLWRVLLKTYCKPNPSILLYISPETSLKRSNEKNEPFSEPLERRVERIDRYMKLADKGTWKVKLNTEEAGVEECWKKIRGNID